MFCSYPIILYYCSPDLRDLRSFPTRRSSDLRAVFDPFEQQRDEAAVDRVAAGQCSEVVCLIDRKSTRLNSSHPSISYAVFCLKKKNDSTLSALLLTLYLSSFRRWLLPPL